MKKIISTVLASAMLLSSAALPASASFISTQDKPVYVCLGDSNSAGYGLDDYEENAKIAKDNNPSLYNGYFLDGFWDSGTSSGYYCDEMYSAIVANANGYDLRQHGHSAWRTDEAIRMLSDDFAFSDSYWDDFWLEGMSFINESLLEGEHEAIYADVCEADYISLQFSSNDILTQSLFDTIFDTIEAANDLDLDFNLDEIRSCEDIYNTLVKVSEATSGIIDIASIVTSLDARILENEETYEENIITLMDRITELNPDAQIIIVGALNPLSVTGDYYARLITTAALAVEKANSALLKECSKRDNCTFVDITKAHTYGIAISDFITAFDMDYINAGDWSKVFASVKLVHPDAEGHAYIAEQILNEIKNSQIEIELTASYAKLSKRTTLKWNKVDNALRYNVYRAVGDGSYQLVYTTICTRYIDLITRKGNNYSYKVEAVLKLNGKSVSGISNTVTVTAK